MSLRDGPLLDMNCSSYVEISHMTTYNVSSYIVIYNILQDTEQWIVLLWMNYISYMYMILKVVVKSATKYIRNLMKSSTS